MKKTIFILSTLTILILSSASAKVADMFYIDDNFYNEISSLTILDS
jgi:hypothetical protein